MTWPRCSKLPLIPPRYPIAAGPAVSEIALSVNPDSGLYASLYRWVHSDESRLGTLFPATLLLYERLRSDPELSEEITNFWSGEPLPIARIRNGLKQVGELSSYPVKTINLAELSRQRFLFFSRLVIGAGYAGWVILIDEAEFIGRYTILQRGKSYAELACLLGSVEGAGFPGTAVVATITDDFGIKVLGEKDDLDCVGPKLRSKGTEEYALLAAATPKPGMRVINVIARYSNLPDEESLRSTYEKLKRCTQARTTGTHRMCGRRSMDHPAYAIPCSTVDRRMGSAPFVPWQHAASRRTGTSCGLWRRRSVRG